MRHFDQGPSLTQQFVRLQLAAASRSVALWNTDRARAVAYRALSDDLARLSLDALAGDPALQYGMMFRDYESGQLDENAVIEGFQYFVDSGLAW